MADSALSFPQCRVREHQCHEYDKHTHSNEEQDTGDDIFNPLNHDYLRRKCDTDHAAASSDAAVMTVGRRPKQYTASGAMNVSQAMAIVNRKTAPSVSNFLIVLLLLHMQQFRQREWPTQAQEHGRGQDIL